MPIIVAELSGNHNGSLDRMLELIRVAKECGADAVKFQCYTPDTLAIKSNKECFQIKDGPWAGKTYYDLYQEAHTPREWFPAMVSECKKADIEWFATPFDKSSLRFLESIDCPRYKISSFDIDDFGLIRAVRDTGKHIILSTGMAEIKDIKLAVSVIGRIGYSLLHCVSEYPAEAKDMALYKIRSLQEDFGVFVGLSDHSNGSHVAVAATALSAFMIEKHLCLNRADGGPDAHFSMEPAEFKQMVKEVKDIHVALTSVRPDKIDRKYMKSAYATKMIPKGGTLTENNTMLARPRIGIDAGNYENALNRIADKDIEAGSPVTWGDLA